MILGSSNQGVLGADLISDCPVLDDPLHGKIAVKVKQPRTLLLNYLPMFILIVIGVLDCLSYI